jgi:hypothetical protein
MSSAFSGIGVALAGKRAQEERDGFEIDEPDAPMKSTPAAEMAAAALRAEFGGEQLAAAARSASMVPAATRPRSEKPRPTVQAAKPASKRAAPPARAPGPDASAARKFLSKAERRRAKKHPAGTSGPADVLASSQHAPPPGPEEPVLGPPRKPAPDDGFEDRRIVCRACAQSFVFRATHQRSLAARGFTGDRARCDKCQMAKKSKFTAVARRASGKSSDPGAFEEVSQGKSAKKRRKGAGGATAGPGYGAGKAVRPPK